MISKTLSLIFRFFRSIMLFANFWHKICNLLEKKASFSVHLLNFTLEKLNEVWYSKEKDSGQRNYQSVKSLRVAWVRRQRCRFCGVRIQNRSSKQYMLPVSPRLTPVTEKIANMTNKMIKYMNAILFWMCQFHNFFLASFSVFQVPTNLPFESLCSFQYFLLHFFK